MIRGDLERDAGFDQPPAEENVLRVGDRRRGDEGAAMALDGDDVVVRERLQRAAHDRAAGVEQGAELLLGQFRAGRQALVDDGVEHAAIDRRGAPALAAAGARLRAVPASLRKCIDDSIVVGRVVSSRSGESCSVGRVKANAIVPCATSKSRERFCIQYR